MNSPNNIFTKNSTTKKIRTFFYLQNYESLVMAKVILKHFGHNF